MNFYKYFSTILITLIVSSGALANDCGSEANSASSSFYGQLNSRLVDPGYTVIVLGRHGKASQENKFTAAERAADPAKVALDIQRPLESKGKRGAKQLSRIMSKLMFREVGMWGSYAKRVIKTAKPTIQVLGERVQVAEFDESLYYADVPTEMRHRLDSPRGEQIPHAFLWGHGKTTLALFKRLTGATDGFLPTAAVMIVALKADSWREVFEGGAQSVEAFAWSPNSSHRIEGGDVPIAHHESLEGLGGLESGIELESVGGGLESGSPFESAYTESIDLDEEDVGFEFSDEDDGEGFSTFVIRNF